MVRLAFIFLTTLCLMSSNFVANDIVGVWLNKNKDAQIKVFGSSGQYYGQIIWIKTPIDVETGKPKLDKHNDDAKLKTRPILNLQILNNLVFDADDQEWTGGSIYDPKSGNSYSLTCTLKDKNVMELRGYIGFSLLGRTDFWTRVK